MTKGKHAGQGGRGSCPSSAPAISPGGEGLGCTMGSVLGFPGSCLPGALSNLSPEITDWSQEPLLGEERVN